MNNDNLKPGISREAFDALTTAMTRRERAEADANMWFCRTDEMIAKAEEENMRVKAEAKRLEDAGHKCVSLQETYPCKLNWCGNEPCSKKPEYDFMFCRTNEMIAKAEAKDARVRAKARSLKKAGHRCVSLNETHPCKLSWCGNDPCNQPMYCTSYESMVEKESKRVYGEVQRLRKAGHLCVIVLESNPPQLSWCGNEEKCEK